MLSPRWQGSTPYTRTTRVQPAMLSPRWRGATPYTRTTRVQAGHAQPAVAGRHALYVND